MVSPEIDSWDTLVAKYRKVAADAAHLGRLNWLPDEHPAHLILRPIDIARYIGMEHETLRRIMRLKPGARSNAVAAQPMWEERQRVLTRFFQAWEAGLLVKAKVNGKWQVVHRHADTRLAQMAPAPKPEAKVIPMTIDRSTFGLKVGR